MYLSAFLFYNSCIIYFLWYCLALCLVLLYLVDSAFNTFFFTSSHSHFQIIMPSLLYLKTILIVHNGIHLMPLSTGFLKNYLWSCSFKNIYYSFVNYEAHIYKKNWHYSLLNDDFLATANVSCPSIELLVYACL